MSKKITITLNENQATALISTLNSHIFDMQNFDFDGGASPLDRQSAAQVRTLTNVINKVFEAQK